MNKKALRSAADAAIKQGEASLRDFEKSRGHVLPPVPEPDPNFSAPCVLRRHYFALKKSLRDADLYSAILQNFLESHHVLLPRGVFKRDLCTDYWPPAVPFQPGDSGRGVLLPAKPRGRPNHRMEAWATYIRWLEMGEPTFGKLANDLNKGKRPLTPTVRKRLADKYRQQVNSLRGGREKKTR